MCVWAWVFSDFMIAHIAWSLSGLLMKADGAGVYLLFYEDSTEISNGGRESRLYQFTAQAQIASRFMNSLWDELIERPRNKTLRSRVSWSLTPSNPLGVSLTFDELHLLINFIIDKGIHLISEEIYSSTVFNSPNFVSVMEVLLKIRNLMNDEVCKLYTLCTVSWRILASRVFELEQFTPTTR